MAPSKKRGSDCHSPLNMEEELIKCLRHNKDAFAYKAQDMSGIHPNFIEHKLFTESGCKASSLEKEFGDDKRKTIK